MNVPDWRDPEAYTAYKGLGVEGFRWQFLRRSPHYRNVWTEHAADPWAKIVAGEQFGLEELIDPDKTETPNFFNDCVIAATGDEEGPSREVMNFVERAIAGGLVIAVLDPLLSFDENKSRIKLSYEDLLREHGIERTRADVKVYPEFLRIIDGTAAGATAAEIAATFPDDTDPPVTAELVSDRLNRAKDAAEKLTGYPCLEPKRAGRPARPNKK